MSNLLKFNSVVIRDQDKFVIDSNKMVDEIIEHRRKIQNEIQNKPIPDEDGFVCGLDAATVEQLVSDSDEPVMEVHHEIDLSEAHRQEETIINQARTEAETIMKKAQEAGYEQGLMEGRSAADEELAKRVEELEQEYANKSAMLEAEYAKKKAEMEPQLVEVLLEVFSKITHTIADNKKDMVVALVNGVLKNTEMSKEYLIKVSEEDYNFLITNKDLINQGASKDIKIDICAEPQLKRNQCVIESDVGVFDCSLDIQLENLINDIRVLSCLED